MAQWKGHRYQIKTAQGEIVGESRYFKMTAYLWYNMKDRDTLVVTDTIKNGIVPNKELLDENIRYLSPKRRLQ